MIHNVSCYDKFLKKLESMCEYIENGFENIVGKEISNKIGNFFLFSFVVSKPCDNNNDNNDNNDNNNNNNMIDRSISCFSLDKKNGKYRKLETFDDF